MGRKKLTNRKDSKTVSKDIQAYIDRRAEEAKETATKEDRKYLSIYQKADR